MSSLRALLENLGARWEGSAADVDVTGLCTDSRLVKPGDLFVALRGHRSDGHDHAAAVVRAGAAAILAEKPLGVAIPVVTLPSTADALSPVAARFYKNPSRALRVAGITGTNGKTTITYMLERLLTLAGRGAGVIGTIEYRWPDHVEKAVNTTPHAAEVQRLLRDMAEAGVTDVSMEVSSHSLALHRVEDVSFSVAIFTNLTQDHLDFHKDMEGYFKAKARLFSLLGKSAAEGGAPGPRRAVINRDDPWGSRFLAEVKTPVWTYGIDGAADLHATNVDLTAEGGRFDVFTPAGKASVRLRLVGRHNIYNALAALGGGLALGISLPEAVRGLQSLSGVAGRLERVTEHADNADQPSRLPFGVFVDYAHTEDALRNVLSTLRPLTKNRLIVLFGCGGDRDKTKRPRMGETAARLADHVVVTSDNPRTEDPQRILQEVEEGVRRVSGRPFDLILDREEAIARAVAMAQPGDVLLLAGKGHETYQIFKDKTVDFDDRDQARRRLRDRLR